MLSIPVAKTNHARRKMRSTAAGLHPSFSFIAIILSLATSTLHCCVGRFLGCDGLFSYLVNFSSDPSVSLVVTLLFCDTILSTAIKRTGGACFVLSSSFTLGWYSAMTARTFWRLVEEIVP